MTSQNMKFFVLRMFGSLLATFFGRFLGSEGTAVMSTSGSLVLFAILIFGLIFLFRIFALKINIKPLFIYFQNFVRGHMFLFLFCPPPLAGVL